MIVVQRQAKLLEVVGTTHSPRSLTGGLHCEQYYIYIFAETGEQVRFAVTIPYVETNLADFLEQNKNNAHLEIGVLTKSRRGRDVELLQIGKSGPQVTPVLVTARHHATESIASYVHPMAEQD